MKATAQKISAPSFTPVALTIELQTRDELDRFAAIFNYTPIADALRGSQEDPCAEIRKALEGIGADCNRLFNRVTEKISGGCRR